MKKIITLFALMLCLCANAQENAGEYMYICRNSSVERMLISEIDSVTFVEPTSLIQHQAVDLGLSIKWASCNVGATKPEEYGGYYAWGEIVEKEDYSWDTYKWCIDGGNTMIKYCTDGKYGSQDNKIVLNLEDDVAHVKWGGNWRMPTFAELKELCNCCIWQWTNINGVNGHKVTGPNGNSIFLPAAGIRSEKDIYDVGEYGYCWSSLHGDDNAYDIYFSDGSYGWGDEYRCCGVTVRPVCE